MAFPQIDYCLVCEEIRLERLRLVTLLGFYGVTPKVEILVSDFNKPVERLVFVFLGDRGKGCFRVSMQISDEDGKLIITQLPPTEVVIGDPERRFNLGLGVIGLKFPHPSRYNLTLLVDSEIHYKTSFEVRQGRPEDFA